MELTYEQAYSKLEEILKKIPSKKIITKYKLKKLIKLYKN